MRFVAPCYDGEELVVTVHRRHRRPFEVGVSTGERKCVVGSAALADAGRAVADFPTSLSAPAPAPDDRPAPDDGFFVTGRVLGSVPLATDQATVDAYLTGIGEPSTTYAVDGVVHPGHLLGGANRVLTANVVLPAWLHVESDVRHLRAVSVGEDVEVRARIAERLRAPEVTDSCDWTWPGWPAPNWSPPLVTPPSGSWRDHEARVCPTASGPACSISTAC